ncbi:MAG: hypothetical protein KatS3mg057_1816 [Herpetosiphonaceae bacterium]|nr:MAG: hypothetical protein KatS3mg057_1816 [Herpetosiphonaceae bacterium]
MAGWQEYHKLYSTGEHTVVGSVEILEQVWSPELRNRRDLLVYLPPSYSQGTQRYPVIYMHDGQNLFDRATSYAGEWEVDETMESLSHEGLEAIIVGIPNAGKRRIDEYTPFRDRRHGGGSGEDYLAFVIETIKPMIDGDFRTKPEREHTAIIGSSLGGLISLYAFFRFPAVFGLVGALSPALWFADQAMLRYLQVSPPVPGKMYIDAGGSELSNTLADRLLRRSTRYLRSVRSAYQLLVRRGYTPGKDILYVEEAEARHHEMFWARRLPTALRFLLSREQAPGGGQAASASRL